MTIAIIPARGGSKRIPRKNIRDFCGQPMISYASAAARAAGLLPHSDAHPRHFGAHRHGGAGRPHHRRHRRRRQEALQVLQRIPRARVSGCVDQPTTFAPCRRQAEAHCDT